jgi:hypothetical protein
MEPILSLIGFLDQAPALEFLEKLCILPDPSMSARLALWNEARARLGPAFERAGDPEILELPADTLPFLQGVMSNPRFEDTVEKMPWSFKQVEIDPLLSFQQLVYTNRAAAVTAKVSHPPALDEMLRCCLPQTLESVDYQVAVGPYLPPAPTSFAIRTKNSNLRVLQWGHRLHYKEGPEHTIGGVAFGTATPLLQVMRFNGRCYLKNGFHRMYGLRKAGATHMPCLFIEGPAWDKVGAAMAGGFDQSLLESPKSPTCAHFTEGRAYELSMRDVYRVITVTWQESWMSEG